MKPTEFSLTDLDELDCPDGFDFKISVPRGWTVRHRNMQVRPLPSNVRVWLMETDAEDVCLEPWTDLDIAKDGPAIIFYRGKVDIFFRAGATDIERQSSFSATLRADSQYAGAPHSTNNRGMFVNEGTYFLTTK
jgi:hypothetical protein